MKTPWSFVICLAATVLSGAVLILLTPTLIQSGGVWSLVITVGLGVMVVVFGAIARSVRPSLQTPGR